MLTIPYAPQAANTSARAPSTTIASHRCDCNESRIFCSMVLQIVAEWTGLEPATPGVTGRYSNQLNYHSACWWVLRGSNPRPSPCKGDALPAELSTPLEEGREYTRRGPTWLGL